MTNDSPEAPDERTPFLRDLVAAHNQIVLKQERRQQLDRSDALEELQKKWKRAKPQLEDRLNGIESFDLASYQSMMEMLIYEDDSQVRAKLIKDFSEKYDTIIAEAFPGLPKPEKTETVILAITSAGGVCLEIADLASCPSITYTPPYATEAHGGDDEHTVNLAGGRLNARVRRAGINAPHAWASLSNPVSVPGDSTQVVVKASVAVTRVGVTLAGAGFAHGWCSIELAVSDGNTVLCNDFRELENRSQWFSWRDTYFITDPGPHMELVCCFDRAASDRACAINYVASVKVAVNGTYFGFSGGISELFVVVDSFTAVGCP